MEKVKLKDIAEFIKTGKTPPTSQSQYFDGSINWYTPGDFNNGKNLKTSKRTLTQKALDEKKAITFPKDTLLITCIGDIGKIGISQEDCSSNQQITAIKPKDEIDVNYLYYWFLNNKNVLANTANNAVVPILNNKTLQEIDFNYPPFATQQRIAAILDQADAIIQNNRAIVQKYNALTQSLFLDMFGDPVKNEKEWKLDKLSIVAPFKKFDGKIKKINGNYWLLNLDMIEQQTGNVIEKKYVSAKEINTSTISFSENQVLYSKLRPYLNKVLIPDESGYGTSELVPMNPKGGVIDKFFLAHLLRTNNFVNYINDKVAGAKMPRVNMDTLRDFQIILPPIQLQNQFAERVAVIEAQKQQAQLELAKSEELFQSLLQRAFNGELS